VRAEEVEALKGKRDIYTIYVFIVQGEIVYFIAEGLLY